MKDDLWSSEDLPNGKVKVNLHQAKKESGNAHEFNTFRRNTSLRMQ